VLISERSGSTSSTTAVDVSVDVPIFIMGMSRSGTTLLSRMLDAHSEIAIFPETWWYVVMDRLGCLKQFDSSWQTCLFLNEVWRNLKPYHDLAASIIAREASNQTGYVGPTAPLLEKLGHAYARERKARIWGEKTPGHALWLPQIQDLFPRARVLFCVRDPRDVIVSYDDRWNQGRRDTQYVLNTAALLKHYLRQLLHQPAYPPEQIRWVKYETLTAEPADELRQICQFLGVDFQYSMLAFYRRQSQHEHPTEDAQHHALLSQPATTAHIGRYRNALGQSQIALIERFLREEMKALGYDHSDNKNTSATSAEEKTYAEAERYYQKMLSGDIRRRLRQRGQMKLRAYKIFGRTLNLVPSWRIAFSDKDWKSLADNS